MPTQTRAPDTDALLGRDHAFATLRAGVERAGTSDGGFVLVAGEAGIGKSTLVAEALRGIDPRDVLVATGASWDGDAAPGYWPWIQALRALERVTPADVWADALDASSEELGFLLGRTPPPPPREMADTATFQLYDALARLLVTLSHHRPVVVVLEDLHWADPASLRLLDFVVRHTWFERLLLIGTYRDVEVTVADHPLRSVLPSLIPQATTLTLTGLELEEVRALIRRATGREADDDLVAEFHRRSAGNPFFVEQLASVWHSGGAIDAIPPGIQHLLARRLASLSSTAVDVLTTAALLGRAVDGSALAGVAQVSGNALTTALNEAVAGRLLTRNDEGDLRFVHDLVREALVATLDPAESRKRHLAIVRALISSGGAPGTIAHHAALAVPELAADDAVDLLVAAADDACGRLSADEVVRHLERALGLLDGDDPRRLDVGLDHAEALASVGQLDRARGHYGRLLAEARAADAAVPFARAALGLHELGLPDPDEDLTAEIELLREARERLGAAGVPETDPATIMLLASAARTQALGAGDAAAQEELSLRACELASESGDDALLAMALRAQHDVIWRPGTAEDRLALTDEMLTIAARSDDRYLHLHASLLRFVALLELGDPRAIQEHADLAREAENPSVSPRIRYLARSRTGALDVLQGRFDDAQTAIDDAYALGQELGEVDRYRLWLEQRWASALLAGRLDDAGRFVGCVRRDNPSYATVVATVTAAASGERDLPRRGIDELRRTRDEFPGLFRASLLHALARVAVATGDDGLANELRVELAELGDRWAVVAGGGIVYGPYSYWLAAIDARHDRLDEAIHNYRRAITAAERLDARPWVVEARLGLAAALQERGSSDDLVEVPELATLVVEEAKQLGMPLAESRATGLLDGATDEVPAGPSPRTSTEPGAAMAPEPGSPGATSTTPAEQDAPQPRFRQDGQIWELGFAGTTVRMPSTKGLQDLHVLLRNPGLDIPAVELLDPAGGREARNAAAFGGDPVLDDQARAAFRARLDDLEEQIEAATARGADDRAAQLDRERASLLDELRSATGLGGRSRRLGDAAERARKTVTARIRDTLRRLDDQHPELAEHLRATVSTGAACSYRPSRPVEWEL